MTSKKRFFFETSMTAVAALLVSASAAAQLDAARVTSDISLVVDDGAQVSVLPVISESTQSDLLTYDLFANQIQFAAGVIAPDYDEPLFCFDLGGPGTSVSLQVKDPNGHVIIDNFSVEASLDYVLGVPSSLMIHPVDDQECFYRSDQGVFGLSGKASSIYADPPDTIMRNRFERELSLSLEYQGVPEFVTVGETVSYDLVVTNTGDGALNHVALQELFPENLGVYAAALNGTNWSCAATGDAVCPVESVDPSALRFNDLNSGGADITKGDSLTFTIERTVNVDSITGESIRLRAGAIADPVATGTPFAVDEALMTVVGASSGLNVSATEAIADGSDSSTITVTVHDASGNPVPDETVNFAGVTPVESLNVTPSSGVTDSNGQVVFNSGSTTVAEDYIVEFSSGTLTGNGTVTFTAGAPAAMNAITTVNNVVADGSQDAQFTVTVLDQYGNLVSGTAVDVSDNGGLTSITPTTAFTDIDGNAVFTATSNETGTFTVTFAVSGAGTDSASATFEAGTFSSHAFVQDPTDLANNLVAGEPFTVTVELLDAFGNRLTNDDTTEVFLELRGPNHQDFGSAIVDQGLATFSGLTVNNPGTGYTLRSTVPDLYFVFKDTGSFDVD